MSSLMPSLTTAVNEEKHERNVRKRPIKKKKKKKQVYEKAYTETKDALYDLSPPHMCVRV